MLPPEVVFPLIFSGIACAWAIGGIAWAILALINLRRLAIRNRPTGRPKYNYLGGLKRASNV